MKFEAVVLAGERLQWAEEALEQLRTAADFPSAEKAWASFLTAVGAFYSKLEQGAKGIGASEAWFGRQKNERKKDPLLRYLHFARNSNEHGIERVTDQRNAGWRDVPFGQQRKTFVQKVDSDSGAPFGEQMRAFLYSERLVAITAHDRRYGDSCDPPMGKLGDDRDGEYPQDIAEVAIERLRSILEEAAELV